jgi:glutamate synthase (NADPH/NADH) small chain
VGETSGFLQWSRTGPTRRPVSIRVKDWKEVYEPFDGSLLKQQAGRCMDCGIPFCNNGCPLGNLIPDWNDLVYRGHWEEAIERLHATNNFPEFTGRLCPAPCESACVLGINQDPVSIKQVEVEIIDQCAGYTSFDTFTQFMCLVFPDEKKPVVVHKSYKLWDRILTNRGE